MYQLWVKQVAAVNYYWLIKYGTENKDEKKGQKTAVTKIEGIERAVPRQNNLTEIAFITRRAPLDFLARSVSNVTTVAECSLVQRTALCAKSSVPTAQHCLNYLALLQTHNFEVGGNVAKFEILISHIAKRYCANLSLFSRILMHITAYLSVAISGRQGKSERIATLARKILGFFSAFLLRRSAALSPAELTHTKGKLGEDLLRWTALAQTLENDSPVTALVSEGPARIYPGFVFINRSNDRHNKRVPPANSASS